MFAFVSAFPKSLHCTDEAQQAETVLSAVLSIYIYIYIYNFFFLIEWGRYMYWKIVGASSARMEKKPQLGLKPRSSSLRGWLLCRWAIEASVRLNFSIFNSSPFQSIYIFFGCPSLGVRPWWSRWESGESQGRVCVADQKLKRDG